MSLLSTDMSKAFDSLHPPLLLSKLNAYGFESSTVRLLESYLCDHNYRGTLSAQVGLLTEAVHRDPL